MKDLYVYCYWYLGLANARTDIMITWHIEILCNIMIYHMVAYVCQSYWDFPYHIGNDESQHFRYRGLDIDFYAVLVAWRAPCCI